MKLSFSSLKHSLFLAVVSTGCAASSPGVLGESAASLDEVPTPAAQTFTPLTNAAPIPPGLSQVLTDGRVLAEDADNDLWYTLTPDNTGSYLNGTWTKVATAPYSPLYFASAVLPDGRFFIGGGEYNGSSTEVWTNLAAIDDPLMNKWTSVTAPSGWTMIGDAQSVLLADGRYMMANCCTTEAAVLNPTALTWTAIGTGKEDESNDEEGWTLLPDGRVLTVDSENAAKPRESEIFSPTTGAWTSAGNVGVQLADNSNGDASTYEARARRAASRRDGDRDRRTRSERDLQQHERSVVGGTDVPSGR